VRIGAMPSVHARTGYPCPGLPTLLAVARRDAQTSSPVRGLPPTVGLTCLASSRGIQRAPVSAILGVLEPDRGDSVAPSGENGRHGAHHPLANVFFLIGDVRALTISEGEIVSAIPDAPPRLVITVYTALAFRKHRCENTP
jgi:hypothetical protein